MPLLIGHFKLVHKFKQIAPHLSQMYVNHFFVLQINAHNILNTYIYHQLPATSFGVCYTTFSQTIALLAKKIAKTIHLLSK
jgi:hypothetical protein